jgi:hypothetical protein
LRRLSARAPKRTAPVARGGTAEIPQKTAISAAAACKGLGE